ncbi:MAG: hypothetical protein KTR21_03555 [Rhodobacteraceae bacterium]|nr:hypothetical protein [Paracoccaceae bacterium]
MKRWFLALMAVVMLASLGATPSFAALYPRDVLSGTWRRVPNFRDIPSGREIGFMCAERFRPSLLKDGEAEMRRLSENFVQFLPFHGVYLGDDEVYISELFRDFGIGGKRRLKEYRYQKFGVRKFVAWRTGVLFFVHTRITVGARALQLRVLTPDRPPEYYVKC